MLTNLIREKRKTLSIIVTRKGELQIKAPKFLPLNDIMNFVKSKEKWIINKQEEIKSHISDNREILEYEKVLYLGNKYEIAFISNVNDITIDLNRILMPIKFQNNYIKYIAKWIKNKALSVLENRVLYFATNYNLSFNSLNLINSKNRWGICTSEKHLSFNWRIVMLSPQLIDYIIIHELSHLIEQNHSPNFWKLIEIVMPDYKQRRDDLKRCGFILSLFR